jgi:hypothetical protein
MLLLLRPYCRTASCPLSEPLLTSDFYGEFNNLAGSGKRLMQPCIRSNWHSPFVLRSATTADYLMLNQRPSYAGRSNG